MRATLGEAVSLLAANLHLLTLVSLTVWLPAHVALNYLEYFARDESGMPGRALRIGLVVQVIFDPLVVAATLAALERIKRAEPVTYALAMLSGARAWGRLMFVRLVVTVVVVFPALGGAAALGGGRPGLAGAALLFGVSLVTLALLLRYAVVDSVVVLEGRTALDCWRRAAELTRGRRWLVFRAAAVLVVLLLSVAVVRAAPPLDHFVLRVLFDCALSVSQSLLTIVLFLVYWRARADLQPAR